MWDKKILFLDGKPIKDTEDDLTIGAVVTNILSMTMGKAVDNVRSYELARSIKDKKDINKSDVSYIIGVIKESSRYIPIVTGQVILALEEYGKEQEKKDNKKDK